jgi:hypothetical protein
VRNSRSPEFRIRAFAAGLTGILLALCLTGPGLAAPPPDPPEPPAPPDPEDLRASIEALMLASMKKALDLTRDQELLVGPMVQKLLEERERFARTQRQALREVQVKLRRPEIPAGDFRTLVARLDQLEREHRDHEARLRQEIDRSLSPRQQVQLRLFVPRFSRELMTRIQEARRLQALRPAPAVPRLPTLSSPEEPDPDEEFDF